MLVTSGARAGASAARSWGAGSLRTISASPRRASARRKRSRSAPGGHACATRAPTARRNASSRPLSTSSSSPITLSLRSACWSTSTGASCGCSAARPSRQPHSSAAAASAGALMNTSTESVTISGGTRSARYCSISPSARRSSGLVSSSAESGSPERARRCRVFGSERGFLRRHFAARPRHAQRLEHLAGVGVARQRVLGDRAHHHRDDPGREVGDQLAERLRVAVHHGEQHGRDRRPRERPPAREHLVEHRAEREDVGARGGALALRLLGRHVVGRPHHDAAGGGVLGAPGEAEIHDLDLPVRQHVDVAGLEVAVHHALRVREGEPVEDLLHHRELVLERLQLPLRQQLAQVLALEQLHGHVGHAALLAEVVDRDDVGVVEPGRGLRLVLEALAGAWVLAQLAEHDLDRDVAPEHGVVGAEDLAHGARADLADDLVLADLAELHPGRDDRTTQAPGARARALEAVEPRRAVIELRIWAKLLTPVSRARSLAATAQEEPLDQAQRPREGRDRLPRLAARPFPGPARDALAHPRRLGRAGAFAGAPPLRRGDGGRHARGRRRERRDPGDRGRAPVRLRRLAEEARRPDDPALRAPRRAARRPAREVAVAPLRADRSQWASVRPRYRRRQGRLHDAHRRGRRLPQVGGRAAGERALRDRGGGGDRLREPRPLPEDLPRPARRRFHRALGHRELRHRDPGADVPAARHLQRRPRGAVPGAAGPQRHVGRAGARPGADRLPDHRGPLGKGRPARRAGALRPGGEDRARPSSRAFASCPSTRPSSSARPG